MRYYNILHQTRKCYLTSDLRFLLVTQKELLLRLNERFQKMPKALDSV